MHQNQCKLSEKYEKNISLNELKLIAKIRGIKGYERMSEDKLLSVVNASKSMKTIIEIKK